MNPPPSLTNRSTRSACEITRPARLLADPSNPSLRFKKLGGYEHVWSVRINEQYRAVGERHGDTITWVWAGTHNEFDKLFS